MSADPPRTPELHKKPGLVYVVTDDGIELPVIDVTHPAFRLDISDNDLAGRVDAFIAFAKRQRTWPGVLRRLFYRVALRRSVLARSLNAAAGSFLGGLDTYVMKLGADNLGSYATPVDRVIAATLPVVSMRLRLQDVATMLAAGLAERMDRTPDRPCCLLNIGGGSAIDSLNALLILRRDRPALLADRRVEISVLDAHAVAPRFGARALAALQSPGASLRGVDVDLSHVVYDWTRAADTLAALLAERVPAQAVVGVSSEGALFEYGSDEEIVTNLRVLRTSLPADAFVVGSVTRDDGPAPYLDQVRKVTLRPRSVAQLRTLTDDAGWTIARIVERPFSRNVLLVKA